MKKRFTLLIAVTALLSMSAIGWAQSYITPASVNNQFGAGESATIENNGSNLIVRPYSPNTQQNTLITNPAAITLGSNTTSGQNVVINSYNAGGQIRGWYWTHTVTFTYRYVYTRPVTRTRTILTNDGFGNCTTTNFGDWAANGTGAWTISSQNYIGPSPYSSGSTIPNSSNSIAPPCAGVTGATCTDVNATAWGAQGSGTETPGVEPGMGNQLSHLPNYDNTEIPYTANNASPDDGIPLVQTNGTRVNNSGTYNTSTTNGPRTVSGSPALTEYIRPTTVAIKGTNLVSMTEFLFKDVSWWYRTFTASESGPQYHYHFPAAWTVTTNGQGTNRHPNASDIVTQIRVTATSSPSSCTTSQSGTETITVDHTVVGTRHEDHSVSWTQSAAIPSNRYVNAAIQVLGGADVCLTGDIKDETTSVTNAYLIYPTTGYNFRLRVGGTIDPVNMKHDVTDTHKYYNATTPTATAFPTSADLNIYLFPGATTFDVVNVARSGLYAAAAATTPQNTQYVNIQLPYSQTRSGVLGVKGNYSNSNAIVHTGSTAGTNNPGVIEIGSTTTNSAAAGQGLNRFYIYSGGTIKNFDSACDPVASAPIRFSGANTTGSGSPRFIFDGTASLNILNDGNACTAAIIFADAGAVAEMTGQGIAGRGIRNATSAGDLLVRAHGHVELSTDADFAISTTHNNNVSILSDTSYIMTQAFTHSAAGTGAKGHLTLWARGLPSTGCGGYIDINGALTTTSNMTGVSSWQSLQDAVQKNSGNLAKYVTCNNNDIMSARAALSTGVQTRIQSEHDYVRIRSDFAHTGTFGGLLVQGNGNVTVNGKTEIDFSATNAIGDAVIQSKSGSVSFDDIFTYDGNVATQLYIDGETGVQFKKGSEINYAATGASASLGIQANDGTIAFSVAPFNFNSTSTGNTQIWAGTNVTNTQAAPLKFTYTKAAYGQNIDIYAGQNITTDGTLTFDLDDVAGHTGDIALRAFTNAALLFASASTPAAGCPVRCSDGSLTPTRGNINLNDVVTIDYDGSGNVWIAANADVNINKDYFHNAGKTGPQTGNTKIVAGNSITTGNTATNGGFHYTNNGTGGNFDMKAGKDIITYNNHYITYPAFGSPTNNVSTILKACNNIDIQNSYYYTDVNNTNMNVYWFADNDILSKYCVDSIVYNLSHTTPASLNGDIQWYAGNDIDLNTYVNYNINGKATTKWTAEKNITTSRKNTFNLADADSMIWKAVDGSITFDHDGCGNCGEDSMTVIVAANTGDLEWLAGQNIVAAGVTVFYDKKNSPTTHTLWKAGTDIKTDHTVVFNNVNSDYTKWQAGHNIEVSNAACAPSYVEFNNDANAYYIHWLANNNIKVDGQNGTQIPVDFINYSTLAPCDTNFMKWHAVVDDIDINFADINFRTNDIGEAYWWAGKNIDIDKSNIYFADSGKVNGSGYTEWKAGVSILMDDSKVDFYHDGWGNNGNPLFTGAPSGNQKWYAGENIIATRTPIDFLNFDTLGNAISNQNGYIW